MRDAVRDFQGQSSINYSSPSSPPKPKEPGMGLAIARSIVEAHGGTLAGENCEDGGALFTICLPGATEATLQAV